MNSHTDLYNESIELEDLVEEYLSSKNTIELEKVLIRLTEVYNQLNYRDEDEYLEELINTHLKLINIYLSTNDNKKIVDHYFSILNCYDLLIQNDRNQKELIDSYIIKIKEINNKLLMIDKNFNINKEFPRLKEHL